MDVAIILTYRCNSKCSMCNIWKYPSLPGEEVSLETLAKIPSGIDYLNLSGGEPTLRNDLMQIVDLLYPKAMQLEISSNGLHPERLEPIIRKYPDIKIRFSLEGFDETNNRIRGEKDGFQTKVAGMMRLKELGGKDLGFGTVIQDDNAADLVELYRFCRERRVELATSALHNGFQFHKADNFPYERIRVAKGVEGLITAQLRSRYVKDWFRAYLNMGLIAKILGEKRILPCKAGTDFVFIDPWSDVYACNVRPELKLGNLENQGWEEIFASPHTAEVREQVSRCQQNCWMVGSAKTAMRNPAHPKLPKIDPIRWVVWNKVRLLLGQPVNLCPYVDYSSPYQDGQVARRESYLGRSTEKVVQKKGEAHYTNFGEFNNR